jgi:Family of unknown function (DUF6399)
MDPQPTTQAQTRQAPFRWGRADVGAAFDHFRQTNPSSQRQFAREQGIPRSTLGYWWRRDQPNDPVTSFCHGAAGQSFLKAIVLAALATFALEGACGLRLVGSFLQRSGLDRFVAASRGALQPLLAALEAQLAAFEEHWRPLLAEHLAKRPAPKAIAVAVDEHFHAVKNCLVGIEPVSNFILVECYRDRRDAETWTVAIGEGTRGLNVTVVLLASDLARGLLCCAEKGLGVPHSPDLFHGQRDLLKPLLLPLTRPVRQAQEDLEKANRRTQQLDVPAEQTQSPEEEETLIEAVRAELAIEGRLAQASQRREQAVQAVRGIGDAYHPFDRRSGRPLTAAEVNERLAGHVAELGRVVEEAGLGEKARRALAKAPAWVATLTSCVAWFWSLVGDRLEELELSVEQERAVREQLLPGHYWEQAARRARTAEERIRLKEMAEGLKAAAWLHGGTLATLPEEERQQVERLAHESAGLFSRSSSCVEGRNGRLSLHHHGHGRVSASRLTALRVVHNYLARRRDSSSAAERFFGQKHEDVFAWLLRRMPDLPRPAAKRSLSPAQAQPGPG